MKQFLYQLFILLLSVAFAKCSQDRRSTEAQAEATSHLHHLKKQGNTSQLFVNGQPFLVLGGELGNSTFTSLENMAPVWQVLKAMNINTVLASVYWELIEPKQGHFDFQLLDELVQEARRPNARRHGSKPNVVAHTKSSARKINFETLTNSNL